jgi:nucleoside phosphorylase
VLKILVTFALRQEGISFERRLRQRIAKSGLILGRLDSQEVAICWLGVGVRQEAEFKRILSESHFELVINSGFAGAVRTLLDPGDFVLAKNFSSPELLPRLESDHVFEASGNFLSVDSVADFATKTLASSEGSSIALDMESARVAAVCRDLAVPLVSARMISDRSNEEIPGVFLGQGIRRLKDIPEAVAFAGRMIVLRHRLADKLVELIHSVSQKSERE